MSRAPLGQCDLNLDSRSCSRFWPRCDAAQSELGGIWEQIVGGVLQQFLDPATSTESLWTLIWRWRPLRRRFCSSSVARPICDGKTRWSGIARHRKDAGRDYLGCPSGKVQKKLSTVNLVSWNRASYCEIMFAGWKVVCCHRGVPSIWDWGHKREDSTHWVQHHRGNAGAGGGWCVLWQYLVFSIQYCKWYSVLQICSVTVFSIANMFYNSIQYCK